VSGSEAASSEVESRPRERRALERGEDSPEGCQADVYAPFDKGRLVVRRHVHRSALRGCARQGSVPFDGNRGRESSPSMGSLD
jgi:hypothetical protein